ncbi:MAG TPA: aminotransferase class III-fold pyridoxal phosphate-dependent enzyme [Saprospiraceae bacterium]|nr:aminotransferase class III-fold pyridoxal phosphate-dependent enzyme [Saprospiraceae bacterium]
MDLQTARYIAENFYGLKGAISHLPGEVDFNFKIHCDDGKRNYILKASPPKVDFLYIEFQMNLLGYLNQNSNIAPSIISNLSRQTHFQYEEQGNMYTIRVLSWIEGTIWSQLQCKEPSHYITLGETMGKITAGLFDFDHPLARRTFRWDISQAMWVQYYLDIHADEDKVVLERCIELFRSVEGKLASCRKSVVHNDANENNIICHQDRVKAVIDFGDAIFTQTINDVAISITYGCIDAKDPLEAATYILKGYHSVFPLERDEVDILYELISARMMISLTISALNRKEFPDISYHQISTKGLKSLLNKWLSIHQDYVRACFRQACGFQVLDQYDEVISFLNNNKVSLDQFFGNGSSFNAVHIPLDISSQLLGLPVEYNDPVKLQHLIDEFLVKNGADLAYGGYFENRAFYVTDEYKRDGIGGCKYRTIHLGEDYWLPSGTPVKAPLDGKVFSIWNNAYYKDYGPTIIMEHCTSTGVIFYSLYGHLDVECMQRLQPGDMIKKGDVLAWIGIPEENGGWAPHLHFQIILSLFGNSDNYPGVSLPEVMDVWKWICPDPKSLVDLAPYPKIMNNSEVHSWYTRRNQVLGNNLSLSYDSPLYIIRGQGEYLLDYYGQSYCDFVNNVAHVGHEHPRVVQAIQRQASILNTNTRYLHPLIIEYAERLLSYFPEEYDKVYFVNSGSEANELAMRIAYMSTGSRHMAALEMGYHGNTMACMDVSSYKFDRKGGMGKPSYTHLIQWQNRPDRNEDEEVFVKDCTFQDQLETLLKSWDVSGLQPAAFIHESILSCAGQVMLPSSWYQLIYRAMIERGALTIADEVQTGFGRVGSMWWAFQLHGLLPDMVTLGKPMGNGHPIGAVVCKKGITDTFSNSGLEFFSTFGGNPVSCAAGMAVLDVVEQENLKALAHENGQQLKSGLLELKEKYLAIADVRGEGLFIGVEFRSDHQPDYVLANSVIQKMKNRKILLSSDGPYNQVIKMKPPLCISIENIKTMLEYFEMMLHDHALGKK